MSGLAWRFYEREFLFEEDTGIVKDCRTGRSTVIKPPEQLALFCRLISRYPGAVSCDDLGGDREEVYTRISKLRKRLSEVVPVDVIPRAEDGGYRFNREPMPVSRGVSIPEYLVGKGVVEWRYTGTDSYNDWLYWLDEVKWSKYRATRYVLGVKDES